MRGENWLAGDYTLPGALVKVANTSPFDVPVANSQWLASLHGFDWLRHICALSAQRGPTAAAFYVQDWIRRNPVRLKEAMRPDVTARRASARNAGGNAQTHAGHGRPDLSFRWRAWIV